MKGWLTKPRDLSLIALGEIPPIVCAASGWKEGDVDGAGEVEKG